MLTVDDMRAASQLAVAAYDHDMHASSYLGQIAPGWNWRSPTEFGVNPLFVDFNGYYNNPIFDAQVLLATYGSTLAISFRGTATPYDFFTDAVGGGRNFNWVYSLEYKSFVDGVVAQSSALGITKILFAGHSLGGAMVEAAMADNKDDTISVPGGKLSFAGVSFGSPGVQGIAEAPGSDLRLVNLGHKPLDAYYRDDFFLHAEGDPIFRTSFGEQISGADLVIDLPQEDDGFGQHDKERYALSTALIVLELNQVLERNGGIDPRAFTYVIGSKSGFGTLKGTSTANVVISDLGDDSVYGYGGNDVLDGRAGDDSLDGGAGNDTLFGAVGDDWLVAGADNDILYGDDGYDTVQFNLAMAQYEISFSVDHYVVKAKTAFSQSEGTDLIFGVEQFAFKDGAVSTGKFLRDANPVSPPPPPVNYGDAPGGGTFASQSFDIPGNTTTAASVIPAAGSSAGIAFTSAIETAGDKDFVRVNLVQGATYRILVEGAVVGSTAALADTFFRIRDGSTPGVLVPDALPPTVTDAHDQAVGTNAQVDFTAPYSGVYFISVGAGGASFATLTGGYRLSVTTLGAAPSQPANHNPVAVADSYSAVFGQTIGGNVRDNDTDVDSGNVLGIDLVNNVLTGKGGRLTVYSNGAFQYVAPSSGSNGTDSFTYTVRDGVGGSAQGSLSISLTQPQPSFPTYTNGSDVVTLPNLTGAFFMLDGHDVVTGSSSVMQTVHGGEGNDIFYATGTHSSYLGGPGDDWFVVSPLGLDADVFIGGAVGREYDDFDTMDYSRLTSGITIDFATGTADKENAVGTNFSDNITAYTNANRISAMAGNDTVDGNAGDDEILGGAGSDSLYGGLDNDRLYGGDDADWLDGGAGEDFLDGGDGNDTLFGGAGSDVMKGGTGNDMLLGESDSGQAAGDDRMYASAGNDTFRGLGGYDVLDLSDAPVRATGTFTQVTVAGWGVSYLDSADVEKMVLTPFNDDMEINSVNAKAMDLGLGNDFVLVWSSGAVVEGGQGNDTLQGIGDNLVFTGGDGNDLLYFGGAGSMGAGGAGNDTIYAENGPGVLQGDGGNDLISTGFGADSVQGGDGNDTLQAAGGADTLKGDSGNDSLTGGAGDDSIDGGAGFDVAVFSGSKSGYVIARNAGSLTVSGTDGVDVLSGVEKLSFADAVVMLTARYDFDGDGRSDLFWRNVSDGGNAIWARANSTLGQGVVGIGDLNWKLAGIGDFNADGKADLLWRNLSTGGNAIWRGGDNTQGQAVAAIADLNWKVAGIGDFDGDGVDDILWRNELTGGDAIWKSGSNQQNQAIAAVTDTAWKIAGAGDFDGDGKDDILWRNLANGGNAIWRSADHTLGQGVAAITDLAWQVAGVADFNRDGKDDILWRNQASGANAIWLGANHTQSQAVAPVSDLNWSVAGTGDYDGDGKADILWRNALTGADAVWAHADNTAQIDVAGVPQGPWRIVAQTGAAGLGGATDFDFNGDGKSDIFWRNTTSGVNAIWKSADNTQNQAMAPITDLNWKAMGIGDFNGDGKADILWRNTADGGNAIWRSADNTQGQNVAAIPDQNWKVAGIGDFDGDGKADILWRNTADGGNAIWRSADNTQGQGVAAIPDQNWKVAGIGDFNGDGKDDIFWRNTSTGVNAIWRSADSAQNQAMAPITDLTWKVAGVADFDGDGKDDILWRNTTSGSNAIWRSGDNTQGQNVAAITDQGWQVAGTGDYDGDGRADILWRNESSGSNSIWKHADNTAQQSVTAVPGAEWDVLAQVNSGVAMFG